MERIEKIERFIKQLLKGILVYLLFENSVYFQYIIVYLFKLDIATLTESMRVLLSLFSNCCILLVLFLIYRKELLKEWTIFRNNIKDNIDIGFNYWVIGLIGMFVSNCILMYVFKTGQAANEQRVQSLIAALPFVMLINAGIIGPIIEEIVFRKSIKNIFNNKYVFIVVSGLIFGLVHVIGSATVWTDWLYVIPYACLGFSFAAAYSKTDTIYTPIACHMFHNLILTIVSII